MELLKSPSGISRMGTYYNGPSWNRNANWWMHRSSMGWPGFWKAHCQCESYFYLQTWWKQKIGQAYFYTKDDFRTENHSDDRWSVNAFLDEYEIQKCIGFSSEEIDGYSNFVFVTATGTVYLPNAVNRAIERARVAYNKDEIEIAEKEDREPLIIPHFSAHHLRHTFCTRLCENESNLKVIQSIMGHSDITTTMDVYAEATQEKKQEIVANLQGKIII